MHHHLFHHLRYPSTGHHLLSPGYKPHITYLIYTAIFACLFLGSVSAADAHTQNGPPNILVISSYHQGYTWGDNIISGFRETVSATSETACYFEYLDTARYPGDDHLRLMRDMFATKYAKAVFDCIVTCDDAALRFMITHCRDLFQDVPMVFCGVNELPAPGEIPGRPTTGIVERMDISGTIDIALKLNPSASSLTIIHDNTPAGLNIAARVFDLKPIYGDRLIFNSVSDSVVSDILPRIENLPNDSIVLLLPLTISENSVFHSSRLIVRLICEASPVPIYSLWDFTVGDGVIGGNVVSGVKQGQAVAKAVLRILEGAPIETIPVTTQSPNALMFDYHVMSRFHIDTSILPPGSIIINEPHDFYERHKTLIWLTIISMVLQSVMIIALLLNRTRRFSAERNLNHERTLLKSLMDTIPDMIFFKNRDGAYMLVNRALAEWLGLKEPDEINGKKDTDFYSEEYSAKSRENELKLISAEKACIESEDSEIWPDGRVTWVSAIKVPMLNEAGEITGIIGISRNITERKIAENALRESEEKFRMINEVTREGLVIHENGTIIYTNRVYSRMFGYGAKELIGKNILDIIAPDKRELATRHMMDSWDEPFESTGLRRDGTEFNIEILAKPVFLSGKQYRMGAIRDITEQKLYQQRIENSEHRYRAIFERVPVSIWEYDFSAAVKMFDHLREMQLDDYQQYLEQHPDIVDAIISTFKIIDVNECTVEMYGAQSKNEIIETYGRDELPETRINTLNAIATHLNGGHVYIGETLNKTFDGRIINVMTYVNFPEDGTMGQRGIVVSVDITDKKQLEEKLSSSLEEKVLLLREVHHRVKNNLQVISSLFDLYSMESKDKKVLEVLNNARSKIHTMALIHSQLYLRESFDNIDMRDYTRELLDYLTQMYSTCERLIEMKVTGSLYLPVTTAIPAAIILNELIINAHKHAFSERSAGMIEILFRECTPEHPASITVRDNGIGLHNEFDPGSTNSLGMKLIDNLVKRQLNGTITMDNHNGCTFTITINHTLA